MGLHSALYKYARARALVLTPGLNTRTCYGAIDIRPNGELEFIDMRNENKFPLRVPNCPEFSGSELKKKMNNSVGKPRQFLLDPAKVVFLLSKEPEKDQANHESFIRMLEIAAPHVDYPLGHVIKTLKDKSILESARRLLTENKIKDIDNVTFAVDGKVLLTSSEWQSWWNDFYSSISRSGGENQICSATGNYAPPVEIHPEISGLSRIGGMARTTLAPFKQPSFSSYGFKKGNNCPLSELAAAATGAALNHLVENNSMVLYKPEHNGKPKQVGSMYISWMITPDGKDLDSIGNIPFQVGQCIQNPAKFREADCQAASEFAGYSKSIYQGLPHEPDTIPEFDAYFLVIGARQSRIIPRLFEIVNSRTLRDNIRMWLDDLRVPALFGGEEPDPPKVMSLIFAAGYNEGSITDNVVDCMMQCALFNRVPSYQMLVNACQATIKSFTKDGQNGSLARTQLIRMIINRRKRKGMTDVTLPNSLEEGRDNTQVPFVLGQLLETCNSACQRALRLNKRGGVNKDMMNSHIRALCTHPSRTFAKILLQNEAHMQKLSRQAPGLYKIFNDKISNLMKNISVASIPAKFTPEEQGLLFEGIYHARAEAKREIDARRNAKETLQSEEDGVAAA